MENTFWETILTRFQGYVHWFITMLPQLILAAVILLVTFILARKTTIFTKKRVRKKAKNPLMAGFIAQIVRFIIILSGIVIVLSIIGLQGAVTKILAGAGITAFVLGFAFKDIGENFLAGILLAFKSPFKMGDTIETDGITGVVEGINMRETILKTDNGRLVYVPNGNILKNALFNNTTHDLSGNEFNLSVPQKTDTAKLIEKLLRMLQNTDGVLADEHKPEVYATAVENDKVTLKVKYWIDQKAHKNQKSIIHSSVIQQAMKIVKGETEKP